VSVGSRAFDVLVALLERRERVVTKAELLDLVWPGLVVEENNLEVQVSALRRLLGPNVITTVPGRGYRFTAEIAEDGDGNPAMRHRLAAIMAADVAGYSRLMEVDEDATVMALDAARAVFNRQVQSSDGRVIDMAGDSVLALFETAAGAVSTALSIQEELRRLSAQVPESRRMLFRIAVHLGDVIEKRDGTVYGDGVNIAARLQALAEPGGVTISESVRSAVKGKLDASFLDQGEQTVKNTAEPLHAFKVIAGAQAPALSRFAEAGRTDDLPLPDKPSLAVLPFTNLSNDPEQEYFADGVVDDIISALSRVREFFVIARASSFTYKGRSVAVKQIGRELGVRYVLEGSLRKAGNRVRIVAQLIEAEHDRHIWTDRFEGNFDDIFDLQDRITESVATAIEPTLRLAEIERARSKPTANLQAYDLCLRAMPHLIRGATKRESEEALDLLAKAIQMDPNYSYAKALRAWAFTCRKAQGWETSEEIAEGLRLAEDALSDHRDDPMTLTYVAHSLSYLGFQHEKALGAINRALALNPNSTRTLHSGGWIRAYVLDNATAIEYFHRVLRLNPLDPEIGFVLSGLALAHLNEGRYGEALAFAQRSLIEEPNGVAAHLQMIISLVQLQRIGEAKPVAQRLLAIAPQYTVSRHRRRVALRDPERIEMGCAALRAAGIPE
jgi:adenylate cyclase